MKKSPTMRWKLLDNLDFLDDEEDAQDYDLQIPEYEPVCYCNAKGKVDQSGFKGSKKLEQSQACFRHDNIEGIIDLINTQCQLVQ